MNTSTISKSYCHRGDPKVAAIAVFGIPDDYYGEEVMAWIQLHRGESATEQEIRDFCKGRISHFKIPRHIKFVDDFPMTVTGKMQKFRMRELAIEKISQESRIQDAETA